MKEVISGTTITTAATGPETRSALCSKNKKLFHFVPDEIPDKKTIPPCNSPLHPVTVSVPSAIREDKLELNSNSNLI
ncbi:hypothetical protein J6590_047180 [Homalodisca vitripennis]|nr:hypothetical protein J6590_047180 [Homalodisca vitripennis]